MGESQAPRPVLWVASAKRDLLAMPSDRAVYTVRFSEVIVVLHAFQKKSKKDSATPKQDMDLIHSRLKLAEEIYKFWKMKKGAV
jgi:phage-related protein